MVKVRLKTDALQLRLARQNKSQNWLARKMEMSSGYLSQLTTGVRRPSPKMRTRFLRVFRDASFDDLFYIEPEPDALRPLP